MAISVMLSGNIFKEIIIIQKWLLKDLHVRETKGRKIKHRSNPRINDCVISNISMHFEFGK